jgi:hypothetical protein
LKHRSRPRHRKQCGIAVLGIIIAMVLAMMMAAVFVSRSLLFEHRSASNQYRAMRAFESAEAGLEWAAAMLADARESDSACLPSPGGKTFRDRFLHPTPTGAFSPVPSERPSCTLGTGRVQCRCDTSAVSLAPPSAPPTGTDLNEDSRFAVSFSAVPGDPQSVLVTAHGCTNVGALSCDATGDTDHLQAVAKVHAIFKLLTPVTVHPASGVPSSAGPASGVMVRVPGSWHDF